MRWGECDPAGVVYTPRFAEYVTDAFHEYLEHLFGSSLEHTLEQLDLATPCKALRFVFHHSLRPEQELELAVHVIELRRRTFDLGIAGYASTSRAWPGEAAPPNGSAELSTECAFEAVFTAICVHRTVRSSRELPARLRERLDWDRDRVATQT